MPNPINVFDGAPQAAPEEIFTVLHQHDGVRIERIISTGQATPVDAPYCQEHDEWILLLSGSAGLWIEADGEYNLRPGDCMVIAAGRRHRVTWTASGEPTIWLAIHFRGRAIKGLQPDAAESDHMMQERPNITDDA
jgi:cupin 2 domain-containing protein